jgi:hypothetical protein
VCVALCEQSIILLNASSIPPTIISTMYDSKHFKKVIYFDGNLKHRLANS